MTRSGSGLRRMAMVMALAFGLMAAMPLAGLAQGNSGNAHLCQQNGWRIAVQADTGVGFTSQGECVSYGAQGGTVVALTGIVIPAGHSATIAGLLSACNALAAWYTTPSAGSVDLGAKPYGCESSGQSTTTVTTPVYATGTVLTIWLEDLTCGWAFDSTGNHALVTPVVGGYQVDIMDTGLCEYFEAERLPAGPGGGNLSVQVTIN